MLKFKKNKRKSIFSKKGFVIWLSKFYLNFRNIFSHRIFHVVASITLLFVVLFTSYLLIFQSKQAFKAKAASDFSVQLVKLVIPSGNDSIDAIAPANFSAVDVNKTITLISGMIQHSMGFLSTVKQVPNNTSVRIELVNGTTLRATRSSASADPTEVWVLLIEYTGPVAGPNEFIIRDRRTSSWSAGLTSLSYGPIGNVLDTGKVVLFNSGVENTNTAAGNYDRGFIRSYIDGSKNIQLYRGDGVKTIKSSQQVVEFVGSNWKIQTGEASPNQDPGGTDVSVVDVGNISNVWVYYTNDTDSGNLDEAGHRVYLTSTNNLRLQEHSTATGTKTIRWYLIQNPDLNVQTGSADSQFKLLVNATISGFIPVANLSRSFAWVTGMTNGGGTAHPRDMWQFELQNTSTINLERGRDGQDLDYFYQIVELPTGISVGLGESFEREFPKNLEMSINNGESCTSQKDVILQFKGDNIIEVAVDNDYSMTNAIWQPVEIDTPFIWELEKEDGLKTVYVLFRSVTNDLSTRLYKDILLDKEYDCGKEEGILDEVETVPDSNKESDVIPSLDEEELSESNLKENKTIPFENINTEPESIDETDKNIDLTPLVNDCQLSIPINRYLILGDVGIEVRELQTVFKCLGVFPEEVKPTGYFGVVTREAVIKFQKNNNLDPLGVVGPQTRILLNILFGG